MEVAGAVADGREGRQTLSGPGAYAPGPGAWYARLLLTQGGTEATTGGHWGATPTPSNHFDKLRRAAAFGEGGLWP